MIRPPGIVHCLTRGTHLLPMAQTIVHPRECITPSASSPRVFYFGVLRSALGPTDPCRRPALPSPANGTRAWKMITNTLATYLRQREDRAGPDEEVGVPWKQLVAWYCHQHEEELTSEEDLSNMQKLVNQVRQRGAETVEEASPQVEWGRSWRGELGKRC